MRMFELDKSKGPKGPTGQPGPQGAPAGKGAPGGKGPGGKKPENGPPELPKTLNPADVHGYYMAMADFHDKKAWTNKRISGLKPLWSDDRTMHDDRHLFHRAMRDGFAQKALAVDLAAPMDGASGFAGMKESIQESASPERIQVGHDVHTLEEFVAKYGEAPLYALRSGKIQRFSIIGEAFSGTAPTGALDTINQNKSGVSAKPLPLQHPFPSTVQHKSNAVGKVGTVPKMPGMPKTTEATKRVMEGEDVFEVLSSLREF